MKFPVYVSLVIIGSDEQETKVGLLEIDDAISLAGARLEQGESSLDVALRLSQKYIGDVDPNLFFINHGGFVDAPDRYKDAEQDIVLVYRIAVPLYTLLKNGMEWKTAEDCGENQKRFLKEHFQLIRMALQYGQNTHRRAETVHKR